MIHLADWAAYAGLVGLLIAIAGVIGGSFRVARNTQTVANYREAAQSFQAKAAAQEIEIQESKEKITELETRLAEKDRQIVALQEQIAGLRDLLTNRAAFDVLEARTAEILMLGGEVRTGVHQLLEMAGSGRGPVS